MKPIETLLEQTKDAGMIYDPWTTATIINYEAGYIVRNMFYAMNTGTSESELQILKGHLANARIETADLVMQARVLAYVNGWDFQELINDGEAKLLDRAETYRQREVKPADRMLSRVGKSNWLRSILSTFDIRSRPARSGD